MPNNKYNRDFTAMGGLKRPGRIDLLLFQDVENAGDGNPGLQRVIKNLATGFYDRYVLEGCTFDGATVSEGYVIWDGVSSAVEAKNITINNDEYLYIDSNSVVQKTSVAATAEAGIIIYMRVAGITTKIRTEFEDNKLVLYKLEVRTDLEVDGNGTITGTITIDGDGAIGGTLTVTGDLDVTGDMDLSGNMVFSGAGDISGVGTITATTIVTNADLDMNNHDIDGIKNMSGEAGAVITLEDDLDVNGNDLDMSNGNIDDIASLDGGGNAIVLNDDLNVNSNDLTNINDLDVNGDCDIEGNVDINGTSDLDDVDIDGTLDVAGVTDFHDVVDMNDDQILDAMIVTFNAVVANGNSGAAKTIDLDLGQKQSVTVSENTTLTFAPPDNGVGNFMLAVTNGGAFTLAWATEGAENVYWPRGTEPTWTVSGVDLVAVYYDGTDFYCQAGMDFS